MKEIELLKKVLTTVVGYDEAKFDSLFEQDGEEKSLKKDAFKIIENDNVERVSGLKKSTKTESYDEAYKKATAEINSKWEKTAEELYGIESNGKGISVLSEIQKMKAPNTTGEPAPEAVKKSQVYLQLEEDRRKEIEELSTQFESRYKEAESEFNKKLTFTKVKDKADAVFMGMKPQLSSDPNRAANQKKLLFDELFNAGFQENGDSFIVLDNEGKRVEDEHGNVKRFDDYVQSIASKYYDFDEQSQRDSTGNETDVRTTHSNGKPDKAAIHEAILNAKTPTERAELAKQLQS